MNDLMEFLRARLDDDERVARAAGGAPWEVSVPNMIHVSSSAKRENRGLRHQGYVASTDHAEHQRHIARHDPARVLREVEAKRGIIDVCEASIHGWTDEHEKGSATEILKLLALPYADHPDCHKEWEG